MTMATNMTEYDRNGPSTAGVDLARQDNSSMARSCPWGHHAPQPEAPSVCMDVIDALEGFFALEKRSETLDGSVALRAAQGCKPLLEGNAAGFHLRLTEPAVIRVGRSGPTLVLTDEGYAHVTAEYAARIAHMVERGILARGGYWHQELSKGFAWRQGTTFSLWTGHLVRPVPGIWLLVSGAFNRRCPINLAEYVITDDTAFIPVILQTDLSSLRGKDTWIETRNWPASPHCSLKLALPCTRSGSTQRLAKPSVISMMRAISTRGLRASTWDAIEKSPPESRSLPQAGRQSAS
jgi:hypothetical protein